MLRLRILLPAVLGLFPAVLCRAAIDFTPRYADIRSDGIFLNSLYLQDGPLRIFLHAPADWQVKGEGGSLCMTNPAHPTARVDVRASAVKLPAAIDQKWIQALALQLVKSLPKDAEKGAVTETKVNPLTFNSWKSFEATLSYETAGVKLRRSVCFVTLVSGDDIEMVTGGTEGDFGPARAAGASLLSTWMEPPLKVMNRMLQ